MDSINNQIKNRIKNLRKRVFYETLLLIPILLSLYYGYYYPAIIFFLSVLIYSTRWSIIYIKWRYFKLYNNQSLIRYPGVGRSGYESILYFKNPGIKRLTISRKLEKINGYVANNGFLKIGDIEKNRLNKILSNFIGSKKFGSNYYIEKTVRKTEEGYKVTIDSKEYFLFNNYLYNSKKIIGEWKILSNYLIFLDFNASIDNKTQILMTMALSTILDSLFYLKQ